MRERDDSNKETRKKYKKEYERRKEMNRLIKRDRKTRSQGSSFTIVIRLRVGRPGFISR
jgi:hypothetical protein